MDTERQWTGRVTPFLKCMGICLGTGDEPADSLWVRSRGQTKTGDADVCHRPLNWQKLCETFQKLEEAFHLQALIFTETLTDICWRDSTEGHLQF